VATTNTVTTFAGFLKTRYADNLVNTIPEDYVLQRDFPFGRSRRIGEQYQQAVITRLEQGGTYSAGGAGAFALNDAVAGQISKAILDSSQFVLKSAIDYETLSKALSKGALAYGSSGDQLLRNMAMSTRKRLEIDLWMGQSTKGIGVIDTGGVAGDVYTLTYDSWAPGFFIGMEGAIIELFTSALTTQRTGTPSLVAVDLSARTVEMSAAHTSAAATDVLFFETQRTTSAWNSFLGLHAMATTTSGNLFNIAVASNSIWAPNSYAAGGPLSFQKVQEAAVFSRMKGLSGRAIMYVSLDSWANLLTEQAALRRYGGTFEGRVTLVNGGDAIEFHAVTGRVIIKPSFYCYSGNAYIVPKGKVFRIGAIDVSFQVPGMDLPLAHISESTAGIILFSYYNQAMFSNVPGQVTVITGITET